MSDGGGLAGVYDLKDENQAKQYLENLGIEYRFQCFKENRPDGCHRLADFFESFKRDLPKARNIYASNCDDNKYGHSCFKAGNYFLIGRGGEQTEQKALEYFTKGCDYNYNSNCHNAGLLYSSGKVGNKGKDFKKASEFFTKGCDQKNGASCQELSTYYLMPRPGFEKDMKKAFEFADKACDYGHMYGCVNLSIMYKKGDGCEKNPEMALKKKKAAEFMYKEATESRSQIKFGQSS